MTGTTMAYEFDICHGQGPWLTLQPADETVELRGGTSSGTILSSMVGSISISSPWPRSPIRGLKLKSSAFFQIVMGPAIEKWRCSSLGGPPLQLMRRESQSPRVLERRLVSLKQSLYNSHVIMDQSPVQSSQVGFRHCKVAEILWDYRTQAMNRTVSWCQRSHS